MEGVSPSCLKSDYSHLSCSRFMFCIQSLLCPPIPTTHTSPKGEQQKALQGELCLPSLALLKAQDIPIYTQQEQRKDFTTVLSFPRWCLKQKHTSFFFTVLLHLVFPQREQCCSFTSYTVLPAQQQGQSSKTEIHVFSKKSDNRNIR